VNAANPSGTPTKNELKKQKRKAEKASNKDNTVKHFKTSHDQPHGKASMLPTSATTAFRADTPLVLVADTSTASTLKCLRVASACGISVRVQYDEQEGHVYLPALLGK
jgi:hypothetical protein